MWPFRKKSLTRTSSPTEIHRLEIELGIIDTPYGYHELQACDNYADLFETFHRLAKDIENA